MHAAENRFVSTMSLGEGYHNYHHTFPWDYKTGELGDWANTTKIFIDCMAKIGCAYDLKTATPEMIRRHIECTGDGTHINFIH